MRKFISAAALLVVAGCMLPPSILPDNTYVNGFNDVHSPRDFWMRQIEISGKEEKIDVEKIPIAFRECVADEILSASPPDVTSGVNKFIGSRKYSDYYDVVGEIRSFSSQIKHAKGVDLITYAGTTCTEKRSALPAGATYREMLENSIAEQWAANSHPRAQSPKYFDCVISETVNTFTASEITELDSIAKSGGDLSRLKAIVSARNARFGGSSESQILGKCAGLKGT